MICPASIAMDVGDDPKSEVRFNRTSMAHRPVSPRKVPASRNNGALAVQACTQANRQQAVELFAASPKVTGIEDNAFIDGYLANDN